MPLSQDLQRLAGNKWAVAGVLGAAGVGGYVLLKRNKAASSSTSDTTTGQATTNGVATLDTSGTDLASWLGNYSQSLQNQLNAYQQQLTTALQALQNTPTTGSVKPDRHTLPDIVALGPADTPATYGRMR